MLTIDVARPDERDTVLAITLAAYREYEQDGGPHFWQRYAENIRRSVLEDPGAAVLVARQDGVIRGSALYFQTNPIASVVNEFPEMRLLAVPPESRNLGAGGLLIAECERRAASAGALTLHTTRLMQTARAMYERRGYVRFPQIDFEPVPGFVVWGFKKVLAPS